MDNKHIGQDRLPEKLQFLRSPAAHGGQGPVTVIETHMSWVFLVGERALKLKKPMRQTWLDYSTRAAREQACRDEVRLNRRLAPSVYLGVMPLLWGPAGWCLGALEGPAPPGLQVQDWLVVMRRLPDACLLDRAIAAGRVQPAAIDALVQLLAAFYRQAQPVSLPGEHYLGRLQQEQALNQAVLLQPGLTLAGAAEALTRFQHMLRAHANLLAARADQGHLVEGHGDLRPEHVALLDPPMVIDCLEFNVHLREVDPWDELAFLALECRVAGAAWVGERLLDGYRRAAGESPPAALCALYTAHRALLRARLAWSHLLEPVPRQPARWQPLALRHLVECRAALDSLEQEIKPR